MIRFTDRTPKIADVFQYTYKNLHTRFDNKDRDILPSKIKIVNKLVYKKNHEGKYSAPEEILEIISWSAPQYYPYKRDQIRKDAKRQLKYKHNYEIYIALQKDKNGNYSYYDSKIIWRVGSLKKPINPPQNQIKVIHRETHNKLKKRFTDKKTGKVDMTKVKQEEDKIRKHAKYVDEGDYNSRVRGVNGDNYYRDYPLQEMFDCLYGKTYNHDLPEKIDYPFFCKHALAVIELLINNHYIKV